MVLGLLCLWWAWPSPSPTPPQQPVERPSTVHEAPTRMPIAAAPAPEDPLDAEVFEHAARGEHGLELRNRICALCRTGALDEPACASCSDRPEGRVRIDIVGQDGRPIPMFDGMVTSDCARRMAMAEGHIDLPVGRCVLQPIRFDGALAVYGPPVEVEVVENEEQYQLVEVPMDPQGGVGITVKGEPGDWHIEGLIDATAALDAGLEPGSRLLAVDGVDLGDDVDIEDLLQLLVGPRGTEIELVVETADGERTVTLDRREITGQQIGLLGGQPG